MELAGNQPKYYQVKQILLKEIKEGKYPVDSKAPSLRQLMSAYNISIATATHTMNDLVNEGVIYAVQGKGCFIAETKKEQEDNSAARFYRNKVVVLIPAERTSYYFYELLLGIIDYLSPRGYEVIVHNTQTRYEVEMNLLSRYLANPVGGIIFMPFFSDKYYKHLLKLRKQNIPVVLVELNLKKHDLDMVGLDNIRAVRKSTRYLIGLGHRRIVFIGRNPGQSVSEDRLEGYRRALADRKIRPDNALILDADNGNYSQTRAGAHRRMKDFLSKNIKFTAVSAYNDDVAAGVYDALKEKNLRVPDDISIVGFDDSELSRNLEVPLTTVKQDVFKSGRHAAKQVLKRIADNLKEESIGYHEKILLNTKLIVRKSTKRIKTITIKKG